LIVIPGLTKPAPDLIRGNPVFSIMGRKLRGITGRQAAQAFVRLGGIEKPGKGDHLNIKMPNGMIVTIPGKKELKIGLLRAAIRKAGIDEEEFMKYT
jgi:predicted RNA binding protein YcfA (HicA-like mRNA interferase family)